MLQRGLFLVDALSSAGGKKFTGALICQQLTVFAIAEPAALTKNYKKKVETSQAENVVNTDGYIELWLKERVEHCFHT